MPSNSLWNSIMFLNIFVHQAFNLVFKFRQRFHQQNDNFTVVANGTAMFKITWLGGKNGGHLNIEQNKMLHFNLNT